MPVCFAARSNSCLGQLWHARTLCNRPSWLECAGERGRAAAACVCRCLCVTAVCLLVSSLQPPLRCCYWCMCCMPRTRCGATTRRKYGMFILNHCHTPNDARMHCPGRLCAMRVAGGLYPPPTTTAALAKLPPCRQTFAHAHRQFWHGGALTRAHRLLGFTDGVRARRPRAWVTWRATRTVQSAGGHARPRATVGVLAAARHGAGGGAETRTPPPGTRA